MTSYLKIATLQEKAMCLLWCFETKSVIKTQRRYSTQYGKAPPSDNAIRRWLNQFQETGTVLHRKGAGRLSTLQEDVDRIQEAFSRNLQNSTRRASLQFDVPQTTVWRVFHNSLHLHAY
jgi:transposase